MLHGSDQKIAPSNSPPVAYALGVMTTASVPVSFMLRASL